METALQTIESLRSLGVELRVDGDVLRVHPGSLLTDELREEIKANKGEILAALTARCEACGWRNDVIDGKCHSCRFAVRTTLWLAAKQIYTVGYYGVSFEQLSRKREEMNAVVYDIRLVPQSSQEVWRYDVLKRVLGANYRHIPKLGNERYKEGFPIKIADLDHGIDDVLMEERPVILLCGCKRKVLCHRYVIACAIEERGCTCQELQL